MRAVQFSQFGGPEVLEVVEVDEPHAGPDEIRVAVRACGVNPIDWKVRQGLMGGELPMRMGLEVAGVVDEVGDGVTDVTVGDEVFGPTSGGAAEFALLANWARIPAALDFTPAAALPVAVETAVRGLDELGVSDGQTLLINGGAGAVGTATIQFARARGAHVIVTASESNHARLRELGAEPTTYGDGLVARVRALAGGRDPAVDRAFDMGPGGALPDLIALTGDPAHVLTISDFAHAAEHGVRATGGPGTPRHWDALDEAAALAQRGELVLPVQATFGLEQAGEAERISQQGHVSGKLVLLVQ